MQGSLTVEIKSDVDAYVFENIEDRIRDLLEEEGLVGEIEDDVTGNSTVTRNEELGKKKDPSDKDIRGILVFGQKIWFNDDLRCRLRICGWTKEQQEKLRRAKLVDLTLANHRNNGIADVYIQISQFTDKDRENVSY